MFVQDYLPSACHYFSFNNSNDFFFNYESFGVSVAERELAATSFVIECTTRLLIRDTSLLGASFLTLSMA